MKWNYKIFSPEKPGTFYEELDNCNHQLNSFIVETKNQYKIIRLNSYIDGIDFYDFLQKKELIYQLLGGIENQQFISEVIPQKPVSSKLIIKAMYFDSLAYPATIISTEIKEPKTLEISLNKTKILLTTVSSFNGDIVDDSQKCFQATEEILHAEELNFSNVCRQWNYIGEILKTNGEGKNLKQNYQLFNNTRTFFYRKVHFNNGYPAATGIGIDLPGVIIQSIAFKYSDDSRMVSINNPNQIPAHQYSENVLIGDSVSSKKTTPKFERGKVILSENGNWIFVSGTAAIKGEKHIYKSDIKTQTIETLNLIKELISKENLLKSNIDITNKSVSPITFRAYVKHKKDVDIVSNECNRFFGNIPCVILIADICRDSLLVEIECEFEINI